MDTLHLVALCFCVGSVRSCCRRWRRWRWWWRRWLQPRALIIHMEPIFISFICARTIRYVCTSVTYTVYAILYIKHCPVFLPSVNSTHSQFNYRNIYTHGNTRTHKHTQRHNTKQHRDLFIGMACQELSTQICIIYKL